MNKILKVFFALSVLLAVIVTAISAQAEWTTTDGTGSYASVAENIITLKCDSGTSARSAAAEREYDFSGNSRISISFTAAVKGSDSTVNRRVYIRKNSANQIELLNFCADGVYFMGDKTANADGLKTAENKDYAIDIGINPQTRGICFYFDGTKVYDGTIDSTKWGKLDLAHTKIYIRNNSTSESGASEFVLKNFVTGDFAKGYKSYPENNSRAENAEQLQNIRVEFDGAVMPSVYAKENFVLMRNGAEVEFSVARTGRTAVITPSDGFSEGTEYILTIKAVKDLLESTVAENAQITFATVADTYVKPSVRIDCTDIGINSAKSTVLDIIVESVNGIKKIEMYVNGKCTETFAESTAYIFKAEAGTYSIYATVYDDNDCTAKSNVITLNVAENKLPEITIAGITNGDSVQTSDLKNINISAADSDGKVEKLQIFDGTRFLTETEGDSMTADLSALALGRHAVTVKAYDDGEAYAEKTVFFTLCENATEKVYLNTDYSDYKSSGSTFPSGIYKGSFDEKTAQIKSSTEYGDEHGTVVEYSVSGDAEAATWSSWETYYTSSAFKMEMDIYLLSDDGQIYSYFKTNSAVQDPFVIEGGTISFKGVSGEKASQKITSGEWHNLTVYADAAELKYSAWLDGILVADKFTLQTGLSEIETRIGVYAAGTKDKVGFAFDNLKITHIEAKPQIIQIGYDKIDNCATVASDAKQLRLKTNIALNAPSVTKENINLLCGGVKMPYASAEWSDNGEVVIELSEPLKSNQSYTIELTEEVADVSGMPFSGSVNAYFNTHFADIDVISAEMNASGSKIEPKAVIKNSSDKTKTVYVILNIMSGKTTDKMFVKEYRVSANAEAEIAPGVFNISGSQTAEMYFWESLSAQKVITDVCK